MSFLFETFCKNHCTHRGRNEGFCLMCPAKGYDGWLEDSLGTEIRQAMNIERVQKREEK